MNHTTPRALTDEELRQADADTRRWYLRVLTLINLTGCSMLMALQAVDANDRRAAERQDAAQ